MTDHIASHYPFLSLPPMSFKTGLLALTTFLLASGCATIAGKTNMMSDDKVVSESAGALGYEPSQLTLLTRRTEGTNTYVTLRADNGKEFACTINGGNLMSAGMVNPPSCTEK